MTNDQILMGLTVIMWVVAIRLLLIIIDHHDRKCNLKRSDK